MCMEESAWTETMKFNAHHKLIRNTKLVYAHVILFLILPMHPPPPYFTSVLPNSCAQVHCRNSYTNTILVSPLLYEPIDKDILYQCVMYVVSHGQTILLFVGLSICDTSMLRHGERLQN